MGHAPASLAAPRPTGRASGRPSASHQDWGRFVTQQELTNSEQLAMAGRTRKERKGTGRNREMMLSLERTERSVHSVYSLSASVFFKLSNVTIGKPWTHGIWSVAEGRGLGHGQCHSP